MLSTGQVSFLQKILIDELEVAFPDLSVSVLPEVADSFDEYLLKFAYRHFPRFLNSILVGAMPADRKGTFQVSGLRFDYSLNRDFKSVDTVVLSLLEIPQERDPPKISRCSKRLNSRGLCKRIMVYYSRSLPLDSDAALIFLSTVFESGSRWLDENISLAARQQEVALVRDLYSYWRQVCPSGQFQQHVWFAAATQGTSFSLFDEYKVQEAISSASEKSTRFHLSPIRIVSEMLTYCVPFETVAAKEAIAQKKPLLIDLSCSKFRESFPELAEAEMINLGGPAICVFPIGEVGESCLVAGFSLSPQNRSKFLMKQMSSHQPELKRRFESKIEDLGVLWRLAKQRIRAQSQVVKTTLSPCVQPHLQLNRDLAIFKNEILQIVKNVVEMNRMDEKRFSEALGFQSAITDSLLRKIDPDFLGKFLESIRAEFAEPPHTPEKLKRWTGYLE